MRPDIQSGATFPDYELLDQGKRMRRLSDIQGEWNCMILTLNRGIYCPKDRQQLAQLVPFSAQCGVGYTRIVTIGPGDTRYRTRRAWDRKPAVTPTRRPWEPWRRAFDTPIALLAECCQWPRRTSRTWASRSTTS
jgi:hypothetical protein